MNNSSQDDGDFGRFLWRLLTYVMICFGLVTTFLDIARPFNAGDYGLNTSTLGFSTLDSLVIVVTEEPRANTALSNLRVSKGAKILLIDPPSYFSFMNARVNQKVRVKIIPARTEIKGAPRSVLLTAGPARPTEFDIGWALIRFFSLCVAMTVLVRQPNLDGALSLSGFIAGIGMLCKWAPYPHDLAIAGYFSRFVGAAIGYPQFILFAASFVELPAVKKRALQAAVLCGAMLAVLSAIEAVTWLNYSHVYWQIRICTLLVTLAIFASGILVLAKATPHATGDVRQRIYWVFATLVTSLSGGILYLIFQTFSRLAGHEYTALTTALLPVGLAYAIQRHRILQFSFAVNRTVIYAIITIPLVPIFALIESETHDLFAQELQSWALVVGNQSIFATVINLVAAVALFSLVRWGHDRCEKVIGYALFRERGRRLSQLHQAAVDIRSADSVEVLARAVSTSVDGSLDVEGSSFYRVQDDGSLSVVVASLTEIAQVISKEDIGLLRLRNCNTYVDVVGGLPATEFPGKYLFPVRAGSRILGVITIALEKSNRAIAPDELNCVCELANSASIAMDCIHINNLERRLASLTDGDHASK